MVRELNTNEIIEYYNQPGFKGFTGTKCVHCSRSANVSRSEATWQCLCGYRNTLPPMAQPVYDLPDQGTKGQHIRDAFDQFLWSETEMANFWRQQLRRDQVVVNVGGNEAGPMPLFAVIPFLHLDMTPLELGQRIETAPNRIYAFERKPNPNITVTITIQFYQPLTSSRRHEEDLTDLFDLIGDE